VAWEFRRSAVNAAWAAWRRQWATVVTKALRGGYLLSSPGYLAIVVFSIYRRLFVFSSGLFVSCVIACCVRDAHHPPRAGLRFISRFLLAAEDAVARRRLGDICALQYQDFIIARHARNAVAWAGMWFVPTGVDHGRHRAPVASHTTPPPTTATLRYHLHPCTVVCPAVLLSWMNLSSHRRFPTGTLPPLPAFRLLSPLTAAYRTLHHHCAPPRLRHHATAATYLHTAATTCPPSCTACLPPATWWTAYLHYSVHAYGHNGMGGCSRGFRGTPAHLLQPGAREPTPGAAQSDFCCADISPARKTRTRRYAALVACAKRLPRASPSSISLPSLLRASRGSCGEQLGTGS